MKFLIGGIIIIIGAILVIKTEWFYNFTGPVDWAEQHLGTSGGTRIFYKLIGVVIIIGAFLAMTGGLGCIMGKIFSSSSTPAPVE
jgi:hypothetical protein